jgi:hypothetical protein
LTNLRFGREKNVFGQILIPDLLTKSHIKKLQDIRVGSGRGCFFFSFFSKSRAQLIYIVIFLRLQKPEPKV